MSRNNIIPNRFSRLVDSLALIAGLWLANGAVFGAEFRAQGRLRDVAGDPITGQVYLSKKQSLFSSEASRIFSAPVALGPKGEFDIQIVLGTDNLVSFHHYPPGTSPTTVTGGTRRYNFEFEIPINLGAIIISRAHETTVVLPEGGPYVFCGLNFVTSPFTNFGNDLSGLIAKNEWDGTRGWCPEDYEKLSTKVNHSYPLGNLVSNGSFELNRDDCLEPLNCSAWSWDMTDMVIQPFHPDDVWSLTPKSGSRVAKVAFQSLSNRLSGFHSEKIRVKPNQEYTLFIHYRVESNENWGTQGIRPRVRTFTEDGTTESTDMVFGSTGATAYSEDWNGMWNTYTHFFKTGPSAYFAKISLVSAASAGVSGEFFFDDVVLVAGNQYHEAVVPNVSTHFVNPMGKVIQTRVDLETSRGLFSDTKYDDLWRPILNTLPVDRNVFSDDFYTQYGFNGYFARVKDYLSEVYPNDPNYAFSEIKYENNPLGRAWQKSAPGAAWQIEGTHKVEEFHSTTTTLNPTGFPDNDKPPAVTDGSALYAYHLTIGEGGEKSRTFLDKEGKLIRSSVKSGSSWIDTDYEYEVTGKPSKIIPPPGPNGMRIETEFDYNSLGDLLSEKSPDFGENTLIYDDANRLRFTQSQSQRDDIRPKFTFLKYDVFGRMIESGEFLEASQFTLSNANNPNFPARDDVNTRISTLNFFDRLPPNRNYCLETGAPTTLIIRDDAPEGSLSEFRDLRSAYDYVKARLSTATSVPDPVRFYQIFNNPAHVIRPTLGSLFAPFPLAGGAPPKNWSITGILRNSPEHMRLMFTFPFTVVERFQEGRLAMSVNCNPELSTTLIGNQQLAVVYDYDKYGNVKNEYEYNGYVREPSKQWQRTSMGHDVMGRLLSTSTYGEVNSTQPQVTFGYVYDLAGRVSSVYMEKDGGAAEFVAQISYDSRSLPTYTYVGPSQADGLQLIQDYNIRGWKTNFNAIWQSSTPKYVESIYYQNGPHPMFNGNIGNIAYHHGTESVKQVDYTYDMTNRLKEAHYMDHGQGFNYIKDWIYNYHPNGVINSTVKDGQIFSYGYLTSGGKQTNRLGGVGFTGSSPRNTNNPNNFTYDGSGKMTSDLSREMIMRYGGKEVPYEFAYQDGPDEGNQYMAYAGGSRKSKFVYRNGEFESVNHYFSNGKEIREVHQGGSDIRKEITSYAGYGRLILQANGIWDKEYFIQNYLGSTVAALNTSGNEIYRTDYEPYGKLWQEVTPPGTGDPISEKFTGKEHDDGIELDYFGARYYDADLGMWISPDAMRQYFSPYSYSQNPIRTVDPDGNLDYDKVHPEDIPNLRQAIEYGQSQPEYEAALAYFALFGFDLNLALTEGQGPEVDIKGWDRSGACCDGYSITLGTEPFHRDPVATPKEAQAIWFAMIHELGHLANQSRDFGLFKINLSVFKKNPDIMKHSDIRLRAAWIKAIQRVNQLKAANPTDPEHKDPYGWTADFIVGPKQRFDK